MKSHVKRGIVRGGFSLIELVIVVVIIGIIAAIAIPRLSRGAAGASDSALKADLTVLRNAVDLYAAEHNQTYPTASSITSQLTTYSNEAGGTNPTKDAANGFIYGPYLRKVPPLPVDASADGGVAKGNQGIGTAASDTYITASGASKTVAWICPLDANGDPTGDVIANTGSATDDSGKKYSDY